MIVTRSGEQSMLRRGRILFGPIRISRKSPRQIHINLVVETLLRYGEEVFLVLCLCQCFNLCASAIEEGKDTNDASFNGCYEGTQADKRMLCFVVNV